MRILNSPLKTTYQLPISIIPKSINPHNKHKYQKHNTHTSTNTHKHKPLYRHKYQKAQHSQIPVNPIGFKSKIPSSMQLSMYALTNNIPSDINNRQAIQNKAIPNNNGYKKRTEAGKEKKYRGAVPIASAVFFRGLFAFALPLYTHKVRVAFRFCRKASTLSGS
jgi:hypothetical protein